MTTPYQQLAFSNGTTGRPPTREWLRTANVLRAWAVHPSVASIPPAEQGESVCEHIIRRWTQPIIRHDHFLGKYAELLRTAPGSSDWRETEERVREVESISYRYPRDEEYAEYLHYIGRDKSLEIAQRAIEICARYGIKAHAETAAVRSVGIAERIYGQNDIRAEFLQNTEEWIALALAQQPLPPKLQALGVLNFDAPRRDGDGDAYAVAWDAMGGNLPTDGTDDALRVRDGRDGTGFIIFPWARRTALARCVVRLRLVAPVVVAPFVAAPATSPRPRRGAKKHLSAILTAARKADRNLGTWAKAHEDEIASEIAAL